MSDDTQPNIELTPDEVEVHPLMKRWHSVQSAGTIVELSAPNANEKGDTPNMLASIVKNAQIRRDEDAITKSVEALQKKAQMTKKIYGVKQN